jgi:hypothetical protein
MTVRYLVPWLISGALSLNAQTEEVFEIASPELELAARSSALAQSNGHPLGVIPDNNIVSATSPAIQPLTPLGKFHLAFKDSVDPFTFVSAGFYAGIAQWQNAYSGYGQGAQGYAKRCGAASADQAIGNFFTEAMFPTLLHQDPRYFRLGIGSQWSRLGYALSRTLITRSDTGKTVFNSSEFLGNAAALGVSALYYPASQCNIGEVGEKWGLQIVGDTGFNVLSEFWPDMRRKIFHKDR